MFALVPQTDDTWIADVIGPAGKRAFGGQLAAQALAAAGRTVPTDQVASNLHTQFLRPGDAGRPVRIAVDQLFTGRTAATRRVLLHQDSRLLLSATASFAVPTNGLEHGHYDPLPGDPSTLPQTGPPGPAPGIPPGEFDIRVHDQIIDGAFVRRLWWRAVNSLPNDALLHSCIAVFVTDVYLLDTVLQTHGRSHSDRTIRWGSTDHSVWFHRPIIADKWSVLESRSPAAARGRGIVQAQLTGQDGAVTATLTQESLVSIRAPQD